MTQTPADSRWRAAALGIVLCALGLRLAFLGSVNLLPEEAYYWNYAQHLDIGYLDHPPMVAWLIWLGTGLLGNTEFGVRMAPYLGWMVAAAFCFRLAQDLYGRTAAFIAVSLFASLPFYFGVGMLMTPDSPLTVAWAGALFFLARALLGMRAAAWWGVGICLGLGMLSKYTIALLGPAALLFMAINPEARAWFRRPQPYLAVLLAMVLFSPVIIWNAQHDWASFMFQGPRRVESPLRFSLFELLATILVILTPVGVAAAVRALMPRTGKLDPKSLFVATFTLVPLSVFVAFSLFHEIKLDWTGPLWLAVLPKIAVEIDSGLRGFANLLRRLWAPTIVILLVIYGAGLYYLAFGLPGVGYGRAFPHLPVAWKEFGKLAAEAEEEVEAVIRQEPLRVGMDKYFLSSEMAFYDPLDNDGAGNTAGRSLIERDALMYDYWFPADRQKGRTVILFALKPGDLTTEAVAARFESLDAVQERAIYKRSIQVGRFYYRVGHNYRPG